MRAIPIIIGVLLISTFAFASSSEIEGTNVEVRKAERVLTPEEQFDSLTRRYYDAIKNARERKQGQISWNPPVVLSFETKAGTLYFYEKDIRYGYLNSRKSAWLRVGKELSTESGVAVENILQNARDQKLASGFTLVEKKESPADYGKIYTSYLLRGDEYFRTYFQTIRIQGTYGSHSMAYTYFFEAGLLSRRQQWEKEQAENKFGG
jgi:hypothetical protein